MCYTPFKFMHFFSIKLICRILFISMQIYKQSKKNKKNSVDPDLLASGKSADLVLYYFQNRIYLDLAGKG